MFSRVLLIKVKALLRFKSNQPTQTITLFNKSLNIGRSFRFNVIHSYSTTSDHSAVSLTKSEKNGSEKKKGKIISSLNFKSARDATPFYDLPISTLYQIKRATDNDVRNNFCENRLYYIASQIQCHPAELSAKLAKRCFVYKLSFEWLQSSLNTLLAMGVPSDRIIRDLWVLKYHHKTISERLQRIKDMGIDSLFPWMVRCSPEILNRHMKSTQDTKSILGNTNTTQMYLASRLNISTEELEEICLRIPALKTIRAIKVKHFLDFLLKEGFGIEYIAKKPRILTYSPKTVKQRLEHLRQLGVTDINLNLLCRSKKDFKRACDILGAKKDCTNNT